MRVMRRYLTAEEQARLLNAARACKAPAAQRDYWWMRLLLDTGLRVGEFSRLTVGQAHHALETGWIVIPAEHRKGKRADHEVRVTAPVREALAGLLGIAEELEGGAQLAWQTPLVSSRSGRALSVRSYQDRTRHWCRVAGLPPCSPHWFRHTRAMNILRKTTAANPLGVVQASLGHVSLSSTGVYTGLTKEDLAAALDSVDGPRRVRRSEARRQWRQRAAA